MSGCHFSISPERVCNVTTDLNTMYIRFLIFILVSISDLDSVESEKKESSFNVFYIVFFGGDFCFLVYSGCVQKNE